MLNDIQTDLQSTFTKNCYLPLMKW